MRRSFPVSRFTYEKKFIGLSRNDMRALSVIYVRNTAIDLYRKNRKRPFPLEDFSETADDTDRVFLPTEKPTGTPVGFSAL